MAFVPGPTASRASGGTWAFCPGWRHQPGQKGGILSRLMAPTGTKGPRSLLSQLVAPTGTREYHFIPVKISNRDKLHPPRTSSHPSILFNSHPPLSYLISSSPSPRGFPSLSILKLPASHPSPPSPGRVRPGAARRAARRASRRGWPGAAALRLGTQVAVAWGGAAALRPARRPPWWARRRRPPPGHAGRRGLARRRHPPSGAQAGITQQRRSRGRSRCQRTRCAAASRSISSCCNLACSYTN